MDGSTGARTGASATSRRRPTLRARYPDWDALPAVRARLDPDGCFANDWTERVLGGVPALAGR